jgi:hypothetical protein
VDIRGKSKIPACVSGPGQTRLASGSPNYLELIGTKMNERQFVSFIALSVDGATANLRTLILLMMVSSHHSTGA